MQKITLEIGLDKSVSVLTFRIGILTCHCQTFEYGRIFFELPYIYFDLWLKLCASSLSPTSQDISKTPWGLQDSLGLS